MRTALIAGASGLVARAGLRRLLDEPLYTSVIALVRRPLDVSHPKLRTVVTDVEDPDPALSAVAIAPWKPPASARPWCGGDRRRRRAPRILHHDEILHLSAR